mmetsp:Transcript_56116/g.162534  ORF Transcript_56116/g.162534 Transcript_56116/m.162534 type:complete len:620 (-) Transcript_56116:134-1993(-)
MAASSDPSRTPLLYSSAGRSVQSTEDGCCAGFSGIFLSFLSCCQRLWGFQLGRQRATAEVAPVIRERILTRTKLGVDVLDIHTLLVRPDPARNLANTYRSIAPIGKGGFGSVFRVKYLPTGEERAIKMIPKPSDSAELAKVLTEVELLVRLDHPNIEKFFEYFEDQEVICLATELVTGGNLGELDPASDSAEEIRWLFLDVVAAVGYCHSQGVAHRDLKFENCLLTEKDGKHRRSAKVIDFGLSAVRPSGEKADNWMSEAVGTVYFIAPEVLNSEDGWSPKYGPKCDMWSIGIMLYIVLTDRHPFARSAASTDHIMWRIQDDPVRVGPLNEASIDEVTQDLILRLLEKDPTRRLDAEVALRHPFFDEGSPGRHRSAPSTPKTSPKSMRSMVGRICSFARFSRFERAILTIVAHDARRREVEDLRAAFASLDTHKAGWLTREGVKAALADRGVELREAELETAFAALDPDDDNNIQYTDWLAATIRPSVLVTERAMKEVWDFFDIHGTGKVSMADIAEVLGEDVVALGLPTSFRAASDGNLSWEAFQKLVRHVATKLQSQVDASLRRQAKDKRSSRNWRKNLPSRRCASSLKFADGFDVSQAPMLKSRSKSAELAAFLDT